MSEDLSVKLLLDTETVALRDVICRGDCRHKSAEECARSTFLVFPYQGVFMRHLGSDEVVGEANQVMLFNQDESYRISHPVKGGDSCLSIAIDETLLRELAPKELVREGRSGEREKLAFEHQRLRIDARAQALVALLRHGLQRGVVETLEAEVLTLTLVKRALGERTSHVVRATAGRRKLVDRAKLTLTSDLGRRWTLGDIAAAVGVSPVYLTQVFQQVEGLPLYRYQLRLRLARALDLLPEYADLTTLSMELGFSSHSHFSSAFKQAYDRTPKEFQQMVRGR